MKKLGFKVALFFTLISLSFTGCMDFWQDVIEGINCPTDSIYLYPYDDYEFGGTQINPVTFSVGQTYEIDYEIQYSLENSKSVSFILKSTDPAVAVPEKTSLTTSVTTGSFKITAVGEGDCMIKMYVDSTTNYEDNQFGCDVVYVKVNPKKEVQIVDSNGNHLTELKVYKNDSTYLYSKNNTGKPYVRWNTSNGYIVSVNSSGYIKALAEGTAKITLEAWGGTSDGFTYTDECYVTVLDSKGWSISITNGSSIPAEFYPGDTYKLNCTVNVDGVSNDVYWESDNKAVATVASDGTVKAVSAGTANIYAVLSENTGVKSSPVVVKVLPPPVSSNQFFWGKWTRMDNGKNYEIEETAVIYEGKSFKINSSTDAKLDVNGIGKFTKISDRQINWHDDEHDIDVPFYRQGGTNLAYTVHVVGFTDEIGTANASDIILGRAASTADTTVAKKGLKVKSQSEKYSTYTDEGTTDENGNVTLKAPVQGDTQTITIEDETTHDIVIVSGLKIDNDGSNMGTVPFVGKNDYSLKVTGTIPESAKNNGYLYGNGYKSYPLTLTISNISEIKSATSSCKISTDDPKLSIKLVNSPYTLDSVAISSMKSGATKTIQLEVSYADLVENFVDTEIKIEVENMNTKRVWSDYVPLRFFAGQMPITITTANTEENNTASLNGFLIYPDGNSKFFAVPDHSSKTIYIPVFGTTSNYAYRMVFSGATVTGNLDESTEMYYKVLFDSEVATAPNLANWKQSYDFGEDNDTEAKAKAVEGDFEAYLSEGDIDFYTINVKSESKKVYE